MRNLPCDFIDLKMIDTHECCFGVLGDVMGELCAKHGAEIYSSCRDMVLTGVRTNLERQPVDVAGAAEQKQAEKIREKLAAGEKVGRPTDVKRHSSSSL